MPDIIMDTNATAPPTESATEQPTSPVSNDQDELARLRAENASLKRALMQGQYIDSPAMFDLPAELQNEIRREALRASVAISANELRTWLLPTPFIASVIHLPDDMRPRFLKQFLEVNLIDVELAGTLLTPPNAKACNTLKKARNIIQEHSLDIDFAKAIRSLHWCIGQARDPLPRNDPESHPRTSTTFSRCANANYLELVIALRQPFSSKIDALDLTQYLDLPGLAAALKHLRRLDCIQIRFGIRSFLKEHDEKQEKHPQGQALCDILQAELALHGLVVEVAFTCITDLHYTSYAHKRLVAAMRYH